MADPLDLDLALFAKKMIEEHGLRFAYIQGVSKDGQVHEQYLIPGIDGSNEMYIKELAEKWTHLTNALMIEVPRDKRFSIEVELGRLVCRRNAVLGPLVAETKTLPSQSLIDAVSKVVKDDGA